MIKNTLHTAIFTLALMLMGTISYAQKGGTPINSTVNLCQLYVANAFTPNGDNINERFVIKYNGDCEMLEYNMKVFDRWGRLVYESDDADTQVAWDGTSEGRDLKEGVYMWRVYAKLIDPTNTAEAEILNKQGTVVLIR